MKILENRTAVITGGGRGIGKAIGMALAREGANIAFSYRSNEQTAQEACRDFEALGVRALAVKSDVGDEEQVKSFAEKVQETFGGINILVNNAGSIGVEVPLVEMTKAQWDEVIRADLTGVFLCCKYFIPLIEKGDGKPVGKIINISSELSKKGRACYEQYCAAKGGVNSFTMSLALELAPDILVNIVAPGPVETDMILEDMEPEWVEKEKDIPLKRLGTVEEISAAALLLASDKGNFFCGQFISPNGGAVFF